MKLRYRMGFSYGILAMLCVFSMLVASRVVLERQFQEYVLEKRTVMDADMVALVLSRCEHGRGPGHDFLAGIGETALNQGIILMVRDSLGSEIFCMSCLDGNRCEDMMDAMEQKMKNRYPNWRGKYEEHTYPLKKDGVDYGTVTLGYYGPFFYSDPDMRFISALNRMSLAAAAVSLFAAAAMGCFMAYRMARPLRVVTEKAADIARGKREELRLESGTDEIDRLIESVNAMSRTLELQEERKKRMNRDYAHELRTPITALLSNLDAMAEGVLEPTHGRIVVCRDEILRLSRMISRMGKIAEAEDLHLSKEPFCLLEAAVSVAMAFEQSMAEKKISLVTVGEECVINADRDRIGQVIWGILSNAARFTPPGGTVEMAVRASCGWAELTVRDTGSGVPESDLPFIFERLYRGAGSDGSGIGLSVARAIVESHGGTIEAKNTPGCTITIKIPLPVGG